MGKVCRLRHPLHRQLQRRHRRHQSHLPSHRAGTVEDGVSGV